MLDYQEGKYKSYEVGEGEILLVRRADVPRKELLTTEKILATGVWIAKDLEEFGDTLLERYMRFDV